jgi:hypothetical protein
MHEGAECFMRFADFAVPVAILNLGQSAICNKSPQTDQQIINLQHHLGTIIAIRIEWLTISKLS